MTIHELLQDFILAIAGNYDPGMAIMALSAVIAAAVTGVVAGRLG